MDEDDAGGEEENVLAFFMNGYLFSQFFLPAFQVNKLGFQFFANPNVSNLKKQDLIPQAVRYKCQELRQSESDVHR